MEQYNYIICGMGCAGLTFLYEILSVKNLQHKKILVIDSIKKYENDKTWCFWETENNVFENIVNYNWQELEFKSNTFSTTLNIAPYKYKQIKAIDFYNYVLDFAKQFKNITFITEEITTINNENNLGCVNTISNKYFAEYIFNSTHINLNSNDIKTPNSLLQHFKGVEIEIAEPQFNCSKATFMDFTISQNLGTAFVYVLPTTPNKALVEYTFFTKNILQQNEYDNLLKEHISNNLQIKDYKITHTEFGIIPMTDFKFNLYNNKIINIGAVGGCIKPSTGYAFKNIQQQIKQIVNLLSQSKKPYLKQTFKQRKFYFYDSILLEVLAQNKMQANNIFANIFKKNKPQLVLKFLDNETNIFEDLKIMSSVPMKIFLPIAIKKIVSRKW